MWQWLIISAALVCSVIPQLGVLAIPALVIASQRLLHMPLSRRDQLALLGMGLPTPLACIAPLWGTYAVWQRVLLIGALAVAWSPLPALLVWGVTLLVACVPLIIPPTRDATRWLMPVLVVTAQLAWPVWWDVAVVVVALCGYASAVLTTRDTLQWWSAALLCIGVASGAGIVVLPWVCVLHSLAERHTRGLAIMAWWGVAHVCLAAGWPWGLGMVALPVMRALPALTWHDVRQNALVLLVWVALPLDGSVARLQTSLGVYGDVTHDTTWQFVTAAHTMVGGVPWLVLVWCGVLAWAMHHLWRPVEVPHD